MEVCRTATGGRDDALHYSCEPTGADASSSSLPIYHFSPLPVLVLVDSAGPRRKGAHRLLGRLR